MFDNYVVGHGRSYPSTVHHHEHRAPTDESVRLLRDMEKAADDKRIASFPLQSNLFHGHVEEWPENHHGIKRIRCIFEINGKRMTATASASLTDTVTDPLALYRDLYEEVSKTIAAAMLSELLQGHKPL